MSADIEEGELTGEVNENWNEEFNLDPVPDNRVPRVSDDARMQGSGGQPALEKADRAQKRRLKKLQKKGIVPPETQGSAKPGDSQIAKAKSFVDVYGTNARASLEVKAASPLQLRDVQSLVQWVLGDAVCPRWVFLKNKPLIPKVVLVMAHGITDQLYQDHQQELPHLAKLGQPVRVLALNGTVRPVQTVAALLNVQQTRKRKREVAQDAADDNTARQGLPPFAPSHYVMSLQQMHEHGYTVPTLGSDGELRIAEGFIATRPRAAADTAAASGAVAGGGDAARSSSGGSDGGKKAKRSKGSKGEGGEGRAGEAGQGENGDEGERQSRGDENGSHQQQEEEMKKKRRRSSTGEITDGQLRARVVDGKEKEDHVPPPPPPPPPPLPSTAATAAGSGAGGGSGRGGDPLDWAANMVAMDCEMCITEGSVYDVTRVSCVDAGGHVLLDELVMPERPIVDYNTTYSGITAKMMEGVTTSLADIQERLLSLISSDTLLVGHALENDLAALKMVHCNVLDTVFLYPHPRGLPAKPALRVLASRHLKRNIQGGQHDSVVDARAAMDLALLKIRNGPTYGTSDSNCDKLVDVLAGSGLKVRSCLVDKQDGLARYATGSACAVVAHSDAQAAAHAAKAVGQSKYGFVWLQLRELPAFYADRAKHKAYEGSVKMKLIQQQQQQPAPPGTKKASSKAIAAATCAEDDGSKGHGREGGSTSNVLAEELAELERQAEQQYSSTQQQLLLKHLDQHVGEVWAALPRNALLLVVTGQGDTAEVRRLQEMKAKRMARLEGYPVWSTADEAALSLLTEQEMLGLCFCAIKH